MNHFNPVASSFPRIAISCTADADIIFVNSGAAFYDFGEI